MRDRRRRGPRCWGPTLDKIPPGFTVFIKCLGGSPAFQDRLRTMGFREGSWVEVVKQAPLADPLEYRIDQTHISLRREEARLIIVGRAQHHFRQPPRRGYGHGHGAPAFPGRCMQRIRRWMRKR